MTKIVIENKGNTPSILLFGFRVDVDCARKIIMFTSLGFIPYSETKRHGRVNQTSYEIPDGVYCYKRDSLLNTRNARVNREMEMKVFRINDGQMVVLGDAPSGWDSAQKLRLYYPEYDGVYKFIDGESADGSMPVCGSNC